MSRQASMAGWALLVVLALAFYPLDLAHVVETIPGTIAYVVALAIGIRMTAPSRPRTCRALLGYAGRGFLIVATAALVWTAAWFIFGEPDGAYGFFAAWAALALIFGIPSVLLALALTLLPLQRRVHAK